MPSTTTIDTQTQIVGGNDVARPQLKRPLTYSGTLERYSYNDLTPVIGREFEGLQITELLKADDDVIRDVEVHSHKLEQVQRLTRL